jgi:spore coat protein U-like protein
MKIMNKNKTKKSLAKTAIKSLLGGLFICGIFPKHNFALDATFYAVAGISAQCTVSGSVMSFPAYNPTNPSDIEAFSVLTVDCTNGTPYGVSIADTPNGGSGRYKLVLVGGNIANASDYLLVSFKKNNSSGSAMINDTAEISATGTGSSVTAGSIYGVITAGQTGKYSGTFNSTITLNLKYGS